MRREATARRPGRRDVLKILAVGAAVQRPVVRDRQVVVGREMAATLSADHRVIDGAMAAEFLQTLRQMLESPASVIV